MNVISSFEGQHRFLSNFFPVSIYYQGLIYPSLENAYQAAKFAPGPGREKFTLCTPAQAKRYGRAAPMTDGQRQKWDADKLNVMAILLHLKFQPGSELACKLLATGDAELIEGNWWGDTFWGVCRGVGENNLGLLLTVVRSYLRK